MDKPLLKSASEYFRNNNNWLTIWTNPIAGLRIQKLKHVKCLRLVMTNHRVNEYVYYEENPLLYFTNAETIEDMHNRWERESLSESEMKFLIKERWTDYE